MSQPVAIRRFQLLAALLIFLWPLGQPAAAEDPVPPLPKDTSLEESGAVIGEVTIRTRNIFDPEEDPRYLLFANRLHRTTRSAVIESHLLFKPGDRFSRRILDESERALRNERYLYEAEIRPVHYDGRRVDVEVVTRDVWTLNAGIGIGRSGGASTTRFELQDTNLFGTGKGLTLEHADDVDRTTSLVRYDDHAVLGSRVQLGLSYSENSDGSRRRLDLGRPFYSLDSRWSAGLAMAADDRVDSRYALGHVTGQFRHQQELLRDPRRRLARPGGWLGTPLVYRIHLSQRPFRTAPVLADPARAGEIRFSRSTCRPTERFPIPGSLSTLSRTAFGRHGTSIRSIAPRISNSVGSSTCGWAGLAGLRRRPQPRSVRVRREPGVEAGEDHTVLLSSGLNGRWGSGGAEDLRLEGSARYYWRDFGEHLFFVTLEAAAVENPNPDTQLLLGGDNGLRGYPLRYQDGDRRALLTIEQRFFTDFYPFHLVHVGAAAFFDVGRTWGSRSIPRPATSAFSRT